MTTRDDHARRADARRAPGRFAEEVLAKLAGLRCEIARMYMIRKRLEMERDETTRWLN
jgi:hypothetical protein